MGITRHLRLGALVAVVTLLGGCAAFIPEPAKPPVVRPPFHYETLGVHNSCLVESIHFYDAYQSKMGDAGWARVLRWGNEGEGFKIESGHAVVVFVADGKLFVYDINFGFWKLDVPVEKRNDLTEVSPAVERRYVQRKYKPVMERYCEDWPGRTPDKPPSFIFYHSSVDVRDATRVASELGRRRAVKLVEFDFIERGRKQTSVAVAFVFNARLCVYFPRGGTHVSTYLVRDVRDALTINQVIRRMVPGVTEIRDRAEEFRLLPRRS